MYKRNFYKKPAIPDPLYKRDKYRKRTASVPASPTSPRPQLNHRLQQSASSTVPRLSSALSRCFTSTDIQLVRIGKEPKSTKPLIRLLIDAFSRRAIGFLVMLDEKEHLQNTLRQSTAKEVAHEAKR
jgi:hypothetical protein